jgi:hypothetical protein
MGKFPEIFEDFKQPPLPISNKHKIDTRTIEDISKVEEK